MVRMLCALYFVLISTFLIEYFNCENVTSAFIFANKIKNDYIFDYTKVDERKDYRMFSTVAISWFNNTINDTG